MKIQEISAADTLAVRHSVLWPEKSPAFCVVEGDDCATHYGVFVDTQLVCVASIYIDGKTARLRKFATLTEYQGNGIGTMLIEHAVSELQHMNINYFWCDARASAIGFYKRFGLHIEGSEFEKSGVSYFKMSVHWHS